MPARRSIRRLAALAGAAVAVLSPLAATGAHADAATTWTPYVVTDGTKAVTGGEPSIGYDPKRNAVIYGASKHETRMVFDDSTTPATVTQTKANAPTAVTTLDAITFTDKYTGRTFDSQLLGACSAMSYSDDAGASWTPTTGCGQNTLLDHQSVGGGPFHSPVPQGTNPVYADAVYYCAQNGFNAYCAMSPDGGLTFGPGRPISNTPENDPDDADPQIAAEGGACSGLHGHVRVGPDGTAYLPIKGCGGQPSVDDLTNTEYWGGRPALSISNDNGTTWTVHTIPAGTTTAGNEVANSDESDPSADVDKGNRLYLGWENSKITSSTDYAKTSQAVIAYSDDEGKTWSKPFDVSSALGINNVQFPEVIAGDKGRAAFAFLGTNAVGDDQHNGFLGPDGNPAVWHLYVAMTYDGGQSWTTTDTTPNDPVQRGCVDMQGTSNKTVTDNNICSQRNMLDFNDITMDGQGRVLVAFADGCVDACVTDPTAKSTSARDTLMRLTSGNGLLAAYDGQLGVPGAQLPEAPVAVLLPVGAAAAVGVVALTRRPRRHRHGTI
jgi:hypothetical protein